MTNRLPPLPSLRALTAELRALHEAWSHPEVGGEYVCLVRRYDPAQLGHRWLACIPLDVDRPCYGREYIPGDGAPFDATAAARRLLAAARDGGAR